MIASSRLDGLLRPKQSVDLGILRKGQRFPVLLSPKPIKIIIGINR